MSIISDDLRKQIKAAAPVILPERRERTFEYDLEQKFAEERRIEEDKRLTQEALEYEQAEKRQKEYLYNMETGGRHVGLQPHQILFDTDKNCPWCDKKVAHVMDGWNIWKNGKYMDLTTPWELDDHKDEYGNYTLVHQCPSTNEVLKKQVDDLQERLKNIEKKFGLNAYEKEALRAMERRLVGAGY
jgi:hypothetical protein